MTEAKQPQSRVRSISRASVLAAAQGLQLTGGGVGATAGKAADASRTPGRTAMPAEIRRSMWAREPARSPVSFSPLHAPSGPGIKPSPETSTPGGAPARPDSVSQDFSALNAKLSRAEEDLKNRTEELSAVRQESRDREVRLLAQVNEIKEYALKTDHRLSEARKELEEEVEYFTGKLKEAERIAADQDDCIRRLTDELGAARTRLAAVEEERRTQAAPAPRAAEKASDDTEADRRERERQQAELQAAIRESERMLAELREENAGLRGKFTAVDSQAKELFTQVQQLTIELEAALAKRIETEKSLQEAVAAIDGVRRDNAAREKEWRAQGEQSQAALVTASSDLEQTRRLLAEEKARQAAEADAWSRKEADLQAQVHRLEQEAGARLADITKAGEELRKREQDFDAVQQQASAREQERQSQMEQVRNGLSRVTAELENTRNLLAEERARQAAEAEAWSRKEADLQAQVNRLEQEAGARLADIAKAGEELRKREQDFDAVQQQASAREQERQSQMEQVRNGLSRVTAELENTRNLLAEEKARRAAEAEGWGRQEETIRKEASDRIDSLKQQIQAANIEAAGLRQQLDQDRQSHQAALLQAQREQKEMGDRIAMVKRLFFDKSASKA